MVDAADGDVTLQSGRPRLSMTSGVESDPLCGEVSVEQPETVGSAMSRYTTYLVRGSMGDGQTFSSRKRYSDFEWLRRMLVQHFPGVPLPPLPKKQSRGRFEGAFVEARRAGLEDFLRRLFCRRQVVIESPALRRFLQAAEDSMEELKREFDKRPIGDMCREYKVAFNAELRSMEMPPDDSRLVECRGFLDTQVPQLRDLAGVLKEVADNQRAATQSMTKAQERFATTCSGESSALAAAHISGQPRVELLAAIRQQGEVLQDAPTLHYEVLHEAAELELAEAEAMLEALAALEELQQKLQDIKKRVDTLETTQRRLQQGGGAAPSSLGMLWGQKDPDTQLQSTRSELAQASEDAVLAEEFYSAARTISITREVDRFLGRQVAIQRWAKDTFAGRLHATAQSLAASWRGLAPDDAAKA